MTTRGATASGFGLDKADRTLPQPELHGIFHSLRFRAGVHFMACTACPAPVLIHNMNVMEVLVPIAKPGQRVCVLVEEKRLFMTLETQLIDARRIWAVELGWERSLQQPKILRAVRLVAWRATAFAYRPVPLRVAFQQSLHVCDSSARGLHGLVVATQTKIDFAILENAGNVAAVQVMTVRALVVREHRLVNSDRTVAEFANWIMAFHA